MLKVNIDRLQTDLEELSTIGRTPQGGVSRPAFSPADIQAREWFTAKLKAADLKVTVDPAGNIFGRWGGDGPAVVSGSHLDTIVNGGFYDGALGVLSALECIRTIKESGLKPNVPLEVVSFADEEEWFLGFLGSYALTGQLGGYDLENIRAEDGQTLKQGMHQAGFNLAAIHRAVRPLGEIKALVELHIEQGPVLEQNQDVIGVVESVKGDYRYGVTFTGKRNHAASPMAGRRDPMRAAVELIHTLYTRFEALDVADALLTVGVVQTDPGIETVIPKSAYFSIDFRTRERAILLTLKEVLQTEAQRLSHEGNLGLEIKPLIVVDPVIFDTRILDAVRHSAIEQGLKWRDLSSGAGHDAQVMGPYVPTAMIFVPSKGGRSHCPEEFTAPAHVQAGANVLLGTLLKLGNLQ